GVVAIVYLLVLPVGLLYLVLPQLVTAGCDGQAYPLLGHGLADRQQFDLRSVPPGPCRRCRDPVVDLGEVRPEILDGQRRRILFIVTESAVVSHDLMVRRTQFGEDGGPSPGPEGVL